MKKYKDINCKSCGVECKSGKRNLCNTCYNKALKEKAKKNKALERKKVNKEKQKSKREISIKELDTLCSRVIRTNNPSFCHGCGNPGEFKTLQCAHFVSRRFYGFRWDLRNMLPACYTCNMTDPSHVFGLAEYIDKYYGEGLHKKILEARHDTVKMSPEFKRKIRKVLEFAFETGDNHAAIKLGIEEGVFKDLGTLKILNK